jgi:hypothetical protein
LPGAAVATVARAEGRFRVEMPLAEVVWVINDQLRDGEFLTFEFDDGRMSYRGMVVERPGINLLPPESADRAAVPAAKSNDDISGPDGVVGVPLFASYCQIRRLGPAGLAGNARLQADAAEIEKTLVKADKLLRPLGLGRADV